VINDSEISTLDLIRFFEKNLDFELQVIFTVYKGLIGEFKAKNNIA